MLEVTLFTRSGCHLCDEAKELLRNLQSSFRFTVAEVDIDKEEGLIARYGERVPVIAVGGRDRLWGRINAVMLRRLLDGEPRTTR